MWEATLAQMKKHFENQFEDMEQKSITEKQRREEYYGEQLADAEARHQEEYNLLNEEAESLREENQEMKNFLTSQINNLEHEIDIKNRHIESMEKALAELREKSEKVEAEQQMVNEGLRA